VPFLPKILAANHAVLAPNYLFLGVLPPQKILPQMLTPAGPSRQALVPGVAGQ
jgi:hypothetical protein